jgi:hypothetical protein
MREIYDPKKSAALEIDGIIITEFSFGISVRHNEGKIRRTEGTDGPGISVSTPQGTEITFGLNVASESNKILWSLFQNKPTVRVRLALPGKTIIDSVGILQQPDLHDHKYSIVTT